MEAKWSKHSQPDIHQLMCGLVWVLGLILTQPCAPSCSNCLAWKLDCVIVPQFRTYCWGSAKMGRIQFFTTFFEKQKKSFLQQYVVLRQSTQLRHSRKISWNLHDSLDKWWLSFFFYFFFLTYFYLTQKVKNVETCSSPPPEFDCWHHPRPATISDLWCFFKLTPFLHHADDGHLSKTKYTSLELGI